jgi:tetratricopeptide (TPR) repeat protein
LVEEWQNRQDTNNINIEEGEAKERYSTVMSCAYHLHMAGGRYHEKSFSYNRGLAEFAVQRGELDVAERCYKRAIDDAKYLGRVQNEMECLFGMTTNVYLVWGRYEESLSNLQSLLKYSDKVNDREMRASALNGIALIHDRKGEDEQAIGLYNQSLEIAREIGDHAGIANALNNIAGIHGGKGKYEQALKLYNQSLEIARELGDERKAAVTLRRSGSIPQQCNQRTILSA